MILYFADRQLNILGQASTVLPKGLTITDDNRIEDVETGITTFECRIPYDKETRDKVEAYTAVGNYVLRFHDDESELYTIVESEADSKAQEVYFYAEDDGLDLLNDVFDEYEADKAYDIAYYINKFAAGSGFKIGTNEAKGLTRKLMWDSEGTASERIAETAAQFDGCEVSYSFEVDGLMVVNKYINIYKQRGKDEGATLFLNRDIDSIITSKSITNLATALKCTGDVPEKEENPITLKNYKYDDGDFYVDGGVLKSRNALKKWSRYLWKTDESQLSGGHIVKQFDYDTTSPAVLCSKAIAELKKLREIEVNYEVDIKRLPANVRIGDRVNIVDDAGGLYLSARILQMETSVTEQEHRATLGEYLIKKSGIHQKVTALAEQFAKLSVSAARARTIAENAKMQADAAQVQADAAAAGATTAQAKADEAKAAAESATQSAQAAQTAASNAQAAVDSVEESVAGLETTVANAQATAEQAQTDAASAQTKASEATQSAANAMADAADALAAVEVAQSTAESAVTKADEAKTTADAAKAEAETAEATALAAKEDAEKAETDILSLGERLTTVSQTMEADYARKTDLTEATASLQTQITQNASEISSTASRVQTIDETANNAKTLAEAAQSTADAAQEQADKATADAEAAQTAADNAATAAANAQSEADNAKAAAATAQGIADAAQADLDAAKADLATVTSRVDSTEEEIAAAQEAVETAQAAADAAQANAQAATEKANTAQSTANTAVSDAATAQTAANNAATAAATAQATADAAKGDAAAAQAKADEAADAAAAAQSTADTAKTNAATAQTKANEAAAAAATAQQAADDADAKAAQAAADLATAEQNLADVTSRVGATEEEVAAAQAAVTAAQQAADNAQADAEAAQSTADTAKANAATAQTAANNAKTAADNAQADADAAKQAADSAQAAADALAVRVTTAETKITQNSEQIALMATKEEVAQTLGGYYTKTETDAAITVKANEITQTVSETYTTKEEFDGLEVGGRNYLLNTSNSVAKTYTFSGWQQYVQSDFPVSDDILSKLTNGQDVTLSVYIENTTEYAVGVMFMVYTPDDTYGYRQYISTDVDGGCIEPGESGYVRFTCTLTVDTVTSVAIALRHKEVTGNSTVNVHSWKLEVGNKATDWTPAPEDIDQAISDTASDINTTIIEQNTSITQTCEGMIVEALKSYTETGDFNAFVESVNMQLSVLADQMTLKFAETQTQLEEVNGALQEQINTITKYFAFDINGLTIGQVDNPYKVIVDNDRYSMTVNDVEAMYIANGKVYTPEIEVTKAFKLFGYLIDMDASGNVNCGYVGGEG